MIALLKSVWSFPSRLVRSLFVLVRLLFIVLISSKDMETMEFTVIMRIVKALSVTPPDGFCREVGNDRLELGVKWQIMIECDDDLDEIGE
tara:strand:+ start:29 stop:298 length:270 start_codon:yes stop_codon:yes gene_type:complete